MELYRSFIFVPGNRENMLERAKSFKADVIMVDLEDSVPQERRLQPGVWQGWVPALSRQGQRVMVRVNSLDTGLTRLNLKPLGSPDYMASVWAKLNPNGIYGTSTECSPF
ncbi:MAG: hypothetical protein Ct9H300mP11_15540 [Chloroflexota bacterium]|nr:MAG: hypothetical protein Ct9H300mP11_15540 [Chloroflexota bacterium]